MTTTALVHVGDYPSSAVAQRNAPTHRSNELLEKAELRAGLRELVAVVGKGKIGDDPTLVRRLSLRREGSGWDLAVRRCRVTLGENDVPWSRISQGMVFDTFYLPIPEALALLDSPENPELEVLRRERLWEAELQRRAEVQERDRLRVAKENRSANEQRQRERDFKKDDWDRMTSPHSRYFFTLAMLAEKRGDRAAAEDFRQVARLGQHIKNASDDRGPEWPGVMWWAPPETTMTTVPNTEEPSE